MISILCLLQGEKSDKCGEGKSIFYSEIRLGKPGENAEENEYMWNGYTRTNVTPEIAIMPLRFAPKGSALGI